MNAKEAAVIAAMYVGFVLYVILSIIIVFSIGFEVEKIFGTTWAVIAMFISGSTKLWFLIFMLTYERNADGN